jgi:N utilization substance protein A
MGERLCGLSFEKWVAPTFLAYNADRLPRPEVLERENRMKNEFVLAFNEVLEEKQLPRQVILQALEAAMVSAYRRAVNASNAQHIEAKIDSETGKVLVYAEKEIVDAVQDERTEVTLTEARQIAPEAQLGDMIIVESTPKDFGRVAAQTARQVIQQRIREAERDSQMSYYSKQLGEIVNGVVQAVSPQGITLGLEMKAEGIMPRNQQVPGERFRVHDRVRALLYEVKETPRGPQIVLSRSHRNFLRRLLENEVPEIYHGMVEIRSIAREPGQRSKVAVAALQPAVDPVGACVGIRGVRIQAIVRELNDEKIDVIEWNPDPAAYIAKAISPARVLGVFLNELNKSTKTATVVVPEDQLSLAIGRDGQNARLAAKLTSWRIDIKSLPEAASDAINKLRTEPEFVTLAENETDIVPQIEAILGKKAEGRPVTPEEYQILNQFVDRVERGIIRQRAGVRMVEDEQAKLARETIPTPAFEMPLDDLPLAERAHNVLIEAGYLTIGDLMLQMKINQDAILGLDGVGAKVMRDIEAALATVRFPKVEEEITPEEAPVSAEAGAPLPQPEIPQPEIPQPELTETLVEQPPLGALPVEAESLAVEGPAETPIPSEIPASDVTLPEIEIGSEALEAAPSGEVTAETPTATEPATAETIPFDELFAITPAPYEGEEEEEEGEEGSEHGKKTKKAKKKRFTEVEYDPDRDVVISRKKHKRSDEWDETWNQ